MTWYLVELVIWLLVIGLLGLPCREAGYLVIGYRGKIGTKKNRRKSCGLYDEPNRLYKQTVIPYERKLFATNWYLNL